MKKIILFSMILCALLSLFVLATDSNFLMTTVAPTEYSTSTSTAVLFNLSVNWTGSTQVTGNQNNCTLWLKNSSAGAYAQNTTTTQMVNETLNYATTNVTVTLPDSHRYWSYWNCINNVSVELGNSTPVIIDVDSTYDTLSFGDGKLINFSLTTGLVSMSSLQLLPKTTETAIEGRIWYNSTANQFFGRNDSGWALLG